jgi:hypothetical protein
VRLRAGKGKVVSPVVPIILHLGALILTILLTMSGSVNAFSILAAALLLTRALYGLGFTPQTISPRAIGMQEIAVGLGYIVLSAISFV